MGVAYRHGNHTQSEGSGNSSNYDQNVAIDAASLVWSIHHELQVHHFLVASPEKLANYELTIQLT